MRQKDLAEAYRTVRAVPTFIIGNRGIEGFATEADFARLIDEAAAKK